MEIANELVAIAAGVGVLAVIGLLLITMAVLAIDTVIETVKDWRRKR